MNYFLVFFILFFCQNFFVFSLALFILCFERIRIYQQLTTKELKEKREKSIGVYRPSWRNGWRAIQVSVLRLRRGQRCRRDTSTPTHDHCRRLVRVLDPEQLQHTERQTDASWNILFRLLLLVAHPNDWHTLSTFFRVSSAIEFSLFRDVSKI